MKLISVFVGLILVTGCLLQSDPKKLVRKAFVQGNIHVTWYELSYITSGSEGISIDSAGHDFLIIKSVGLVGDIAMVGDTLKILTRNPSEAVVDSMTSSNKIFGLYIIIDTTLSGEEFFLKKMREIDRDITPHG